MNNIRLHLNEIVLLHCIGVLMILVCHILQELNLISSVAELLTSGVPLFLFVSGYLTGFSNNPHDTKWLIKRCKRILLPYYSFLIIVFACCLIFNKEEITAYWAFFVANIQGLKNFVFLGNVFGGLTPPLGGGLGHFWYITILMICYLIIFAVSKIRVINGGGVMSLLVVAWPLLLPLHIQLYSILMFLGGYCFAKNKVKFTLKGALIISLCVLAMIAMRFFAKTHMDGALYYNEFIAPLTTSMVALWIFYFVFYIGTISPTMTNKIASWKIVLGLDSIIYEFYLVHHMFIKGSLSVFKYVNDTLIAILAIVLISLVASFLLKQLCNLITKKISQ